jgi:D-galacturonate reductase
MSAKPLNIAVWGGGMYVAGHGASNKYRGTIGPAILEARRKGWVNRIGLVTTSAETAAVAVGRLKALATDMGVETNDIDQGTVKGEHQLSAWMDNRNYNAAIVSVPDHLHYAVALPLLELNRHCLVVKPLTLSKAHAQELCEAARRRGVVGQVEFHKRYDHSNLILRDRIRQGEIGKPLYAVVEYSQRKMIPQEVFRNWSKRTNVFNYLGVHYVDLLFWATGYQPMTVTAWGQKQVLAAAGIDTWDAIQVVITWKSHDSSPFVSTHVSNWIDPDTTTAMSDQTISVVGTGGRIDLDQKNRGVRVALDGSTPQDINPYFTFAHLDQSTGKLHYSGYGIRCILQFIEDVRAVQNGQISSAMLEGIRPSFQQGIVSTAILEAVAHSLAYGSSTQPVNLPFKLMGE